MKVKGLYPLLIGLVVGGLVIPLTAMLGVVITLLKGKGDNPSLSKIEYWSLLWAYAMALFSPYHLDILVVIGVLFGVLAIWKVKTRLFTLMTMIGQGVLIVLSPTLALINNPEILQLTFGVYVLFYITSIYLYTKVK
ncbi:MAG: hypothetical protein JXQ95_06790 [Alteromonas stellipolaris]|uniref:hypothetical protein n=1 Tax=Alteromonas stellipolaris TaxID=233316 RepID=UPI003B8D8597